MTRITWKAIPLLFASGFCALIYQVAWQRELRLVFGASTAASAAVLAIFIGGMGLGSLLLGHRADSHTRPLALYARLEIGIAVAAALSAPLLSLVRSIYFALGGHPTLGSVGATIARLVLTALVLAVPTMLMGGTLPAIARAVTAQGDTGRRAMSLLYGINTLGAVAGSLLSTFAMLEVFGTRMTLWMAALANLLVALIANMMARGLDPVPVGVSSSEADIADESRHGRQAPAWFVLLASAGVGFAFFLMELVWYRMLGPLLGGTVFTFGLILAIALFGIGLGGAFYAVIGSGRAARLHWFAITCIAEAACLAIGWALGDRLALLALQLRPLSIFGFGGSVAAWSIVVGILVLPAAFVSGVQFPMLIALLGRGRANVGKDAGHTYAANTAGAMLGSLAGGFGLLPLLTAPGSWKLVVFLLVGLGALAATIDVFRERGYTRLVAPVLGTFVCLLLIGAEGPTAAWRHSSIGAGRAPQLTSANQFQNFRNENRMRVVKEWEGVESSVALVAQNDLSFMVNGKSDGAAIGDSPTQVMAGLVGALVHPEVKTGAVIGLGTGSSAGWLGKLPSLERLDVVEIEPVMVEVARACAPVNADVLDNPKVHITFEDAREFLATTKERYDVVFSEPSNPYRAGIASLFTQEFYEAVAERIETGGMLLQWVQAYEIDARTLATIYRTLGSVFPHIETWELRTQDLLLVASREPITHDVARMRARVGEEPYRTALASAWRVDSLEGVLGHYVANGRFAERIVASHDGLINTDDLSPVEFRFARDVGTGARSLTRDMRALAARFGENRPNLPESSVDWAKVADSWNAFPLFVDESPGAPSRQPTLPEEWRQAARFHYSQADLRGVLAAWRNQDAAPSEPFDLELVAMALAEAGDEAVLPLIEKLRAFGPGDPDSVLARLHFRRGDLPKAKAALSASLLRYRHDPWISSQAKHHAIELALALARADRSFIPELLNLMAEPFALHQLDTRRTQARFTLMTADESPEICTPIFEQAEPFIPWDRGYLASRYDCYARAGHRLADKARSDLERFVAKETTELEQLVSPEG